MTKNGDIDSERLRHSCPYLYYYEAKAGIEKKSESSAIDTSAGH